MGELQHDDDDDGVHMFLGNMSLSEQHVTTHYLYTYAYMHSVVVYTVFAW